MANISKAIEEGLEKMRKSIEEQKLRQAEPTDKMTYCGYCQELVSLCRCSQKEEEKTPEGYRKSTPKIKR